MVPRVVPGNDGVAGQAGIKARVGPMRPWLEKFTRVEIYCCNYLERIQSYGLGPSAGPQKLEVNPPNTRTYIPLVSLSQQ